MAQLLRYRELVKNLVLKDLKLKYRDSTLGFLWSLGNPLLLILVYSFAFTRLLRVDIPNFPYFLLVGILPWNFFAQSVAMSTASVVDNGNLIRKIWLPVEVFPAATVFFNLVQYLLALAVLFPAASFLFAVRPSWAILGFLPVLVLHVMFTLGLSFFVATATVFFRDVKHLTEFLLMLLFWLTPVVYDVRNLAPTMRRVIFFNPLSPFIVSYQDVLYRQALPGALQLLVLALLAAVSLFAGYIVFWACKARFAEEV